MIEMCRAVLREHYGIDARTLCEVPGGWSARAYRAGSPTGDYFLKVYDKTMQSVAPWIRRIDVYMPALVWLSRNTALRGHIAYPVLTTDGAYKREDARYVYVLFDYIEGVTVGFGKPISDAQARELAWALAQLHGMGRDMPMYTPALEEDDSMPFCAELDALIRSDAPRPERLRESMRAHEPMLLDAVARIWRLYETVRKGAARVCLCHADLHGNNMMQADRLVIVDWEDLRVAPPESDLFMFLHEPERRAMFDAYLAARPGFKIDLRMLAFYRLRRMADDIWYDVSRLLHDHPDEEETEELYARLALLYGETANVLAQLDARGLG